MKQGMAGVGLMLVAMAVQAGDWQAGIGAGVGSTLYRGENSRAVAIPLLGYQGEQFYAQGPELGWKQPLGSNLTATAKAQWEFDEFDPKGNDIAALRQLDKRKQGALVGGELSWALDPRTTLSLEAMHDAGNRHQATLTTVAVENVLPFSTQQDAFVVSAGATYLPKAYQQYYTGVSASEAARSGLPAYQADAATRYQLGASWRHAFNRHLAVVTRVSVSHLPASLKWDAAARSGSPLVERNVTVTGMLGIHYRF